MKKIEFDINIDNFKNILDILKDLTKIDDVIKIKFDKDEVLFYSRNGIGQNIHAFKSFILPLNDFIITDNIPNIDFVIINAKKFVSNLTIFTNKENIKGIIKYDEDTNIAETFTLFEDKLKINFISGDYKIIKDITKYDIRSKMDPQLSNFSFNLEYSVLNEIKKLTRLNASETTNLEVKDGTVYFTEPRWKYDIDNINTDDCFYSFQSKYLKSINIDGVITVNVFDHFLLFKEDDVVLMIGFELDSL